METGLGDNVAVDTCHLNLVIGLIESHKPTSILELGVGSGRTTKAIIEAIKRNQDGELLPSYKIPEVTLVDNWCDWNGKRPDCFEELKNIVNVVERDEREFVFTCNKTYDFIFSDADHWNTDKWFWYVYDRLLNSNGILIYHDVSTQDPLPRNELRFPNLINILIECKKRGISHMHFDKCSKKSERCFRGFLVIFKSQIVHPFMLNIDNKVNIGIIE